MVESSLLSLWQIFITKGQIFNIEIFDTDNFPQRNKNFKIKKLLLSSNRRPFSYSKHYHMADLLIHPVKIKNKHSYLKSDLNCK